LVNGAEKDTIPDTGEYNEGVANKSLSLDEEIVGAVISAKGVSKVSEREAGLDHIVNVYEPIVTLTQSADSVKIVEEADTIWADVPAKYVSDIKLLVNVSGSGLIQLHPTDTLTIVSGTTRGYVTLRVTHQGVFTISATVVKPAESQVEFTVDNNSLTLTGVVTSVGLGDILSADGRCLYISSSPVRDGVLNFKSSLSQGSDCKVLNLLGNAVWQGNISGKYMSIDVSSWSPGVYVLKAGVCSEKFVIVR
jgi:hypothetical protein